MRIQYAFSLRAAIERGCSIGADHAQSCQLTSSDDHPLLNGPHPRRLSRSRLQTDSFEHDWPQSSIRAQSRLGLGMHINARKAEKELMTNVP